MRDSEGYACFELYQQRLDDVNIPKYTTFSYAWGEKRFEYPIKIDDCFFLLTENLFQAIRTLVTVGESYWIDAICINQSDDVEKSLQIPLMKEIYALADTCLIWLGVKSDDSDLAFQLVEDLSANFNRKGEELADYPHTLNNNPQARHDRTATKLQSLRDAGRIRHGSPEWLALSKLMNRPWFMVGLSFRIQYQRLM